MSLGGESALLGPLIREETKIFVILSAVRLVNTHTRTHLRLLHCTRARAHVCRRGGGGGKVLKLAVDLPKPRILVGDRGDHGEGDRVLGGVIITNGFICIIIRGKYVT